MAPKVGGFLRDLVSPLELLFGSWVGIQLGLFVLFGPSVWNTVLGSACWFALLVLFLRLKRRSLRQWLLRASQG